MLHFGLLMCSMLLWLSTVAALPKPVCEDPRLTADNANVTVTCNITSVFIDFTCDFKKQLNFDAYEPVGLQTQSALISCYNFSSVICDSQCTLSVSVSDLAVGLHTFRVSIRKHGNISESDSTEGISIYPPDMPQLRTVGCKTVGWSSTVVCVEDDEITFSCDVNSGNPAVLSLTLYCQLSVSGVPESNEKTASGTSFVFNERVSRSLNGKDCACIANHATGEILSRILNFIVLSRPSDVICSVNLRSYGLEVSCQIGKVYPDALCQWSYLNEEDTYSTPVLNSQINDSNHGTYTDVGGFTYYKSNCSVTLTSNLTTFKEGLFPVKVKMNPNFDSILIKPSRYEPFITTRDIAETSKSMNCFLFATMDIRVNEKVEQLLEPIPIIDDLL